MPRKISNEVSGVIVLDSEQRFLEYCHQAVARKMLKEGHAVVYSRDPFCYQIK